MREVLVKATAAKLTPSDWKTLAGVLVLLPSYSRLEDNVYIGQVAKEGNVSERQARRSLKCLNELGIIAYRRRGTGQAPRIALSADLDGHVFGHPAEVPNGHTVGHSEESGEILNGQHAAALNGQADGPRTEESFREEDDVVTLDRLLEATDFTAHQRSQAHKQPARSIAWLERAQEPDIGNPAGYAWTGIEGTTWPKPRNPSVKTGPKIDLGEAWRRFLDGFDWTVDDDEGYIRERLRKLRLMFPGDLTDRDALAQWQAKRLERYPMEAAA
jgi:hypothetical protein